MGQRPTVGCLVPSAIFAASLRDKGRVPRPPQAEKVTKGKGTLEYHS